MELQISKYSLRSIKHYQSQYQVLCQRCHPAGTLLLLRSQTAGGCVSVWHPDAFRTPTSRVRSVTETSMIFISAIAAPKSVIKPIPNPPILNPQLCFRAPVPTSRSSPARKNWAGPADHVVCVRITPVASPIAVSIWVGSEIPTVMSYQSPLPFAI